MKTTFNHRYPERSRRANPPKPLAIKPLAIDRGLWTVDFLNLKRLSSLLVIVTLTLTVFVTSCSEDDKPKTLALVTTADATDVTTTTAILNGEITDDGNAKITESGFVYSSVLENPVITDDKIVAEADDDNMLSVLLENLSPSTTYHVRAYAINSEGTAYGESVDVITGNAAPTAIAVTVTGTLGIGSKLNATYTYSDVENDPEGETTIQWYMGDNAAGLNETEIPDATDEEYIVLENQSGKFFRFSVTPKALSGAEGGAETKSPYTTNGIGDAVEVNFIYNGHPVTYGIINSSVTGRKWLDRDLGAPGSPSSINDWQNWGDAFQWGRLVDGHQLITRTGPNIDVGVVTGSEYIGTDQNPVTSSTDAPGHALFIINGLTIENGGNFDWRVPQNHNLWQIANGNNNNPCPLGWRIPTKDEWDAESLTTLSEGFTQLKLNMNNYRPGYSPLVTGGNGVGFYWTSTSEKFPGFPDENVYGSYTLRLRETDVVWQVNPRSSQYACRCIKDE